MTLNATKRRFRVSEYAKMLDAGIFREDDRLELIAGDIIDMSPIGSRHAACVNRLNTVLNAVVGGDFIGGDIGGDAIVSVQNPLVLDDYSAPQPDLALLKPRDDFYADAHPTPADVLLLVEVAETSVDYDRTVKLPLYARAGISEVWLIDLNEQTVEVYHEPYGDHYRTIYLDKPGAVVRSPLLGDAAVEVDTILG